MEEVMNIWVFPGTFDPITIGHETTIRRAAKICDKLVVCVIDNYNKNPVFSINERLSFIKCVCKDLQNVEVNYIKCITAEYAKSIGANVILRGIRTCEEFDKEMVLANYYNNEYPEVETIFLPSCRKKNDFMSSSLFKDVIFHNGRLENIINSEILEQVKRRFISLKGEIQ